MKTLEISMPPFNTTLMGVIKGVADYYKMTWSIPFIYGGTGHAFLMNIHKELCPSGPYCWNYEPFHKLAKNLGIEIKDTGFFGIDNSEQERNEIENIIKTNTDNNIPCSILNLENQLILGYDETGFILAQPWPGMNFPADHLTLGSWIELKDFFHANFYVFNITEPIAVKNIIIDSLKYAIDLHMNPTLHTSEDYGVGKNAYINWETAVSNGYGSSHGNWWNAMVWAECRDMASSYFKEISTILTDTSSICCSLSDKYKAVSGNLTQISNKEMDAQEKIDLLEITRSIESAAISEIKTLLHTIEKKYD